LALAASAAHYVISFLDTQLFFATLDDPIERGTLQPALVLGLLAISVLHRSNEIEEGHVGRMRARMSFTFDLYPQQYVQIAILSLAPGCCAICT
jgi:hypothetical protein